jgi:hypothetical protein
MSKRTKEWIQIIEPDGTHKIASPEWIKKHLGLDGVDSNLITSMYRRIQELEGKVGVLEKPIRQKRIVDLLKEDGGFHTQEWISNRTPGYKWGDVWGLLKSGIVEEKMSGHHKLYGIKENTD